MACARPTLPSPVPFSLPPRAVPAPFAAGLAASRRGGVPVLASKASAEDLGGVARRSRLRPLSWQRNRQAVSPERRRAISRDSLGAGRARFRAGIASKTCHLHVGWSSCARYTRSTRVSVASSGTAGARPAAARTCATSSRAWCRVAQATRFCGAVSLVLPGSRSTMSPRTSSILAMSSGSIFTPAALTFS